MSDLTLTDLHARAIRALLRQSEVDEVTISDYGQVTVFSKSDLEQALMQPGRPIQRYTND